MKKIFTVVNDNGEKYEDHDWFPICAFESENKANEMANFLNKKKEMFNRRLERVKSKTYCDYNAIDKIKSEEDSFLCYGSDEPYLSSHFPDEYFRSGILDILDSDDNKEKEELTIYENFYCNNDVLAMEAVFNARQADNKEKELTIYENFSARCFKTSIEKITNFFVNLNTELLLFGSKKSLKEILIDFYNEFNIPVPTSIYCLSFHENEFPSFYNINKCTTLFLNGSSINMAIDFSKYE